jgi:hypothetical protein
MNIINKVSGFRLQVSDSLAPDAFRLTPGCSMNLSCFILTDDKGNDFFDEYNRKS